MLNNKGFAVSTILYTLLIAFLLFLGATLAMFSSSNSLISNANNDLINGTSFEAIQVKSQGTCTSGAKWYESSSGTNSNTIVRIKSRYGTMYWPKDFNGASINKESETIVIEAGSSNGKVEVTYEESNTADEFGKLTFKDTETGSSAEVTLANICE